MCIEYNHRYTRHIPDLTYHSLLWRRQPWGLKLGIFRFFWPHKQKQMWNKCVHDLRAVWWFTHVYLHTQTTVDAGDIRTWRTMVILITGKTRRPPVWAPCQDQIAQVLGSPFCICGQSFLPTDDKWTCLFNLMCFIYCSNEKYEHFGAVQWFNIPPDQQLVLAKKSDISNKALTLDVNLWDAGTVT